MDRVSFLNFEFKLGIPASPHPTTPTPFVSSIRILLSFVTTHKMLFEISTKANYK